ncbi:carboxylating nicotinate-nucleotide diphosphorylase [Streptomyces sp. NBC_00483]|uniref:carboxylating nicotinate-nucleotide diphosphorylase n=1 Tax=Streptomyces sp. NBC_00483 TaxID=2975756 RepID=UPI002E18042F
MTNTSTNIDTVLASFQERWSPRILTRVNDYDVRLAKVEGTFVWHSPASSSDCTHGQSAGPPNWKRLPPRTESGTTPNDSPANRSWPTQDPTWPAVHPKRGLMEFPLLAARQAVSRALAEDHAHDDITTRWSVPAQLHEEAEIIAKQSGEACGLPVVSEVFHQIDPDIDVKELIPEGSLVRPGQAVIHLSGRTRSLLTGERTALNFLQRMCGIATLTRRHVDLVADLGVQVLDTRKTAPGLRALDKYAVAAGGGSSHRLDLSAMVLLKENHVAAAGGITAAITAVHTAMAAEGHVTLVDVEVENVAQAVEALHAGASWIMLDDMTVPEIEQVVQAREEIAPGRTVVLEASGGITLELLRSIAETGVDKISVGALTHSAPALDLSMLLTRTTDA